MSVLIDRYLNQDELMAIQSIRQEAFNRVVVEAVGDVVGIIPDGDARQCLQRLLDVAKDFVGAD